MTGDIRVLSWGNARVVKSGACRYNSYTKTVAALRRSMMPLHAETTWPVFLEHFETSEKAVAGETTSYSVAQHTPWLKRRTRRQNDK